jgi:glycosyltransferase involved in cell wall biosynthesis
MKILVVSPVPIAPADAGNRVRVRTLFDGLVRLGHEVHLAFLPMEDGDAVAMAAHIGAQRFHVLPWQKPPAWGGTWPRALRKVGRTLGLERAFLWRIDDWYDDRTTLELTRLHARHAFDAVMVEYVFASRALEAFPPSVLRILDAHDCFAMRHRAYQAQGLAPQWFSTTAQDEERAFRRANVVLAIQSREADSFRQRLGAGSVKVATVGHLIDIAPPASPSKRPSAVFVGSANAINVDGAAFFVRQVLPLVRRRQPSFQLVLAGAVSDRLPDQPGVVKLGFVPDLRQAFAAAALAVNPVQMGTGVNIKLLDAMASGLACVSTEAGARGLDDYRDGALVTVPDRDAQAFADAVLHLLEHADERRHLGGRARQATLRWNADQMIALDSLLAAA